jgi:hypothetical protein
MSSHNRSFISWIIFLLFAVSACTTIGTGEPNPYLVTPNGTATQKIADLLEGTFLTVSPSPTGTMDLTVTPSPTATIAPATYYYFDPGIDPLTGLTVPDPANLERRPVMVKVSNWPRDGRPHAGLSSADIVFEYFIGYQMNRFLAVYYGDNADTIGPVRSGRLVDAQLVNLYGGILAYGNADPRVDEVLIEQLGDRALAYKNLPCPPMCGYLTHSATGVYADSQAMTDYAISLGVDNSVQDLRGLHFSEHKPTGDDPGSILRVEYANFSIMEWRFDAKDADYVLWQEADSAEGLILVPTTDRNTGQQLTFNNLVVMFADYVEYASSLHDIEIQDVQTPQEAWFFRDGVKTVGTWRVPEANRPIVFEIAPGEPFALKPGQTWIVIVGKSSEIEVPAEGEWTIYFGL